MKICPKCKSKQSDDKFFCKYCDEQLDSPLSKEEEIAVIIQSDSAVDKLGDKTSNSELTVTLLDRIIGYLSLLGFLSSIVFASIFRDQSDDSTIFIVLIFVFLYCSFIAFLPNFGWELQKWRWSAYARNSDKLNPSALYITMRKLSLWFLFVVATVVLIITVRTAFTPKSNIYYRETSDGITYFDNTFQSELE